MSRPLPVTLNVNSSRAKEFPLANSASPRDPAVFLSRDAAIEIYQAETGIARQRLDAAMQRWYRTEAVQRGWQLVLFPNAPGNRTNKAGVLLSVLP